MKTETLKLKIEKRKKTTRGWLSHKMENNRGQIQKSSFFNIQISDSKFQVSKVNFIIQMLNFRIHISKFRVQISHFRIQISDFKCQTSISRFQNLIFIFQISDIKCQKSDFNFQMSSLKFQISNIPRTVNSGLGQACRLQGKLPQSAVTSCSLLAPCQEAMK